MNFRLNLIFFYCLILFTLAIGLSSVFRLSEKADLPITYRISNDRLISGSDHNDIQSGDIINKINDLPVTSESDIEFIIDSKRIGETVSIEISDDTNKRSVTELFLVDFYEDSFFILISLIIGISYWLTGAFVISAKPKDPSAKVLCLILITFSLAILTPAGYFGEGGDWMGYVIRVSHPLSYIWGSIFFLHFSLIFPGKFLRSQKLIIISLYSVGIIFSILTSLALINSMRDLSIPNMHTYSNMWILTQTFLLVSIISSTLILPVKYKRQRSKNEKAQLEWIFWGTTLGASPFIIFWLIPGIFKLPYILKEEIILSFLLIIPVSFAIAVIKFRLFDIEIVIKRSIIYSTVITIVIILYLGIIYLLSQFANNIIGEDAKFFNVLTAILIALIFNPLRIKVKQFVDSVFYREKYFFDKVIGKVNTEIKECNSLNALGRLLTEEINNFVPVKQTAIMVKSSDGERLRVIDQNNFEELTKNISAFRLAMFYSNFNLPFALKNKTDRSVKFDSSLEEILNRWNINLVIPLTLGSNEVTGAIVLGEKLSGLKYSSSDVELLTAIASSAALAVKRIELQEKLIIEELEKTKHKDLSELKSYFVAAVSHDLKTPLSSIKIFSELLRNEKISREKSIEYLEIIEGETDRLGRMINNVLDYSRIEKGLKKYSLKKIELNNIVNSVLKFMNYEFMMQKFTLEKILSENEIFIEADEDAMNSLLENLFSNAIKYSGANKYLKVTTCRNHHFAELSIEDKGAGISENILKEIFNPFIRGIDTESTKIKGAGLGLSIVKYILDAHNGSIEVQSEIGKGTIFKIIFPLHKDEN